MSNASFLNNILDKMLKLDVLSFPTLKNNTISSSRISSPTLILSHFNTHGHFVYELLILF